MNDAPLDTATALLESVLAETDDPEVSFRVRTALQLLVVAEEHSAGTREVLADADLDDDVRADLRELGYLD